MKAVCFGILLIVGGCIRAQGLAGWFGQTRSQKKDYLEQIAALQVSIGLEENGYAIVDSGLQRIQGFKSGELGAHQGYYRSLEMVNPAIANSNAVGKIMSLQAGIAAGIPLALQGWRQHAGFSADELNYHGGVCSGILDAGVRDVNTLLDVLTPGRLKLSDDERLTRIGELERSAIDRYSFVMELIGDVGRYAARRLRERESAGVLKGLYGMP